MAVLSGIVKNVLVIIILSSFLEILLPEGRVKPFVRFAIGLFIIVAILNPILNSLFEQRDFAINLWDYQLSSDYQEREILERGSRINRQLMKAGESNLSEKIEGQVSAVAMLVPGVKEVETRVSLNKEGGVEKMKLVVRPEQSDNPPEEDKINAFFGGGDSPLAEDYRQIEEKMRGVINNFYGFKDIQIEIEFEGG
jgi:stage III sporulation protein AF